MVQLDLFGRAPLVIIDVHETRGNRENSVKLFIEMLEKEGIYYKIEKLPIGDVILPAGYAIERKTVKDFLNSLFRAKNGKLRLFDQLSALAKTYPNPILLLEGGLAVRPDPLNKCLFLPVSRKRIGERLWLWTEEQINVHPNSFFGIIRKIEEMGIRVIKSFDAKHGAILLYELLKESQNKAKTTHERYAIARTKPKTKSLLDQQIFFLSGLPTINAARARKILSVYGNPYSAIMKIDRWDVDVEGIGSKTVEKIKKLLKTEFSDADKSEPL